MNTSTRTGLLAQLAFHAAALALGLCLVGSAAPTQAAGNPKARRPAPDEAVTSQRESSPRRAARPVPTAPRPADRREASELEDLFVPLPNGRLLLNEVASANTAAVLREAIGDNPDAAIRAIAGRVHAGASGVMEKHRVRSWFQQAAFDRRTQGIDDLITLLSTDFHRTSSPLTKEEILARERPRYEGIVARVRAATNVACVVALPDLQYAVVEEAFVLPNHGVIGVGLDSGRVHLFPLSGSRQGGVDEAIERANFGCRRLEMSVDRARGLLDRVDRVHRPEWTAKGRQPGLEFYVYAEGRLVPLPGSDPGRGFGQELAIDRVTYFLVETERTDARGGRAEPPVPVRVERVKTVDAHSAPGAAGR